MKYELLIKEIKEVESHGFDPLETFLILYWNKSEKARNLISIDDIEKYLKKNPISVESRAKIDCFLREHFNYDVISACFGFNGNRKMTPEEYAEENGISKKSAKWHYENIMTTTWDTSFSLCAMMLSPKHLRRNIFEIQFRLHNMMKAYDLLSGKNTANEHHVGICDGTTLGKDLYSAGFDTLEEIQKANTDISFAGDPKGLNYKASNVMRKYGLNNELWRGACHVVSTRQGLKHPMILAEEDYDHAKVFFNKAKFKLEESAIKEALNGLVYNHNCSGYDIDRLLCGEIWIYFNPIHHDASDRQTAIAKIVELLEKSSLVLIDEEE